MQFDYCAPCLMGLEGLVSGELKRMDARNVLGEDGRVFFSGDYNMLARANLRSRYSERILIVLGRFDAFSFDDLFEGTKALPWEQWIGKTDAFPVKGSSVRSKLFSVSDCQSIIKKAIVERLKTVYKLPWFEETGAVHQVQFHIKKDNVCMMLDTSGEGLHKRGYRRLVNGVQPVEAPMKETLAAAMSDLCIVKHDSIVYDPMCGSGTLAIEAALKALNVAPGIRRTFAVEKWAQNQASCWKEERELCDSLIRRDAVFHAYASDLSPKAVEAAQENARKAGVAKRIDFSVRDARKFSPKGEKGKVLLNPPYGERLLTTEEARELIKEMGSLFVPKEGWSYGIISPDEQFEKVFGRRADKRRKVYNGMIKCQIYIFGK